jgi:hypothetical protein
MLQSCGYTFVANTGYETLFDEIFLVKGAITASKIVRSKLCKDL